jgi:NAD-dependent SIR2 family protein deacetylase
MDISAQETTGSNEVLTGAEAIADLRARKFTTTCRRCGWQTVAEVARPEDAGSAVNVCQRCQDLPPDAITGQEWEAAGRPEGYELFSMTHIKARRPVQK